MIEDLFAKLLVAKFGYKSMMFSSLLPEYCLMVRIRFLNGRKKLL